MYLLLLSNATKSVKTDNTRMYGVGAGNLSHVQPSTTSDNCYVFVNRFISQDLRISMFNNISSYTFGNIYRLV